MLQFNVSENQISLRKSNKIMVAKPKILNLDPDRWICFVTDIKGLPQTTGLSRVMIRRSRSKIKFCVNPETPSPCLIPCDSRSISLQSPVSSLYALRSAAMASSNSIHSRIYEFATSALIHIFAFPYAAVVYIIHMRFSLSQFIHIMYICNPCLLWS